MAKTRRVILAALNIEMHQPHSAQRYVDLFARAKKAQFLVRQGELHALMLDDVYGIKNGVESDEITGLFYRFVRIDPSNPWFNKKERRLATADEVRDIKIPEELLAHAQKIYFVFFPKKHELWFTHKNGADGVGHRAAANFFQEILSHAAVELSYPPVHVNSIPDKEAVSKIVKKSTLRSIEWSYTRPNHDGVQSAEAELQAVMERLNAERMTRSLQAPRGEALKLDQETQEEAMAASRRGAVQAVDLSGEPYSSSDKPMVLHVDVVPDAQNIYSVLREQK